MLNDDSPHRRDLAIALTGRVVSVFGDEMAMVALTLRLQADGARPLAVALLLAAGSFPLLALARPVGRLVDSFDSRPLLVGSGLVATVCTAPLIVARSIPLIVTLIALLGAAASLSSSTWSALIPRIVGEERVAAAVSAQESLSAFVLIGAPAVGGVLTGALGSGVPLALDLASFVGLTAAAALVQTRRRPAGPAADGATEDVRDGFALLRADGLLALLTVSLSSVVLLVGMVDVVLVFLIRDTLHAPALWYGLIAAAWMSGLVLGAVGAGHIRRPTAQSWATIIGAGVVCAALAPFAIASTVGVLIPLSILGGAGNGVVTVCCSTLFITRTPEAHRGRVSAAANAVVGSAQGLSLLAGGVVAAALSPRAIYALAGTSGVALTIIVALVHATQRPRSDCRRAT